MKPIASLYLFSSLLISGLMSGCSKPADPAAEFWADMQPLCGKAYEGEIVSQDAVDDDWRKERIVMHVRDCAADEIRIPLHVGENRSRTWVLTKDKAEVTLRHDHRHEDGIEDDVSQYGGLSSPEMQSASRLSFPADDQTKAIFDAANISVSNDNIWAIEIQSADDIMAYEMKRPNRFFRIEFDTTNPVTIPPDAWGYSPRP